MDIPVLKVEQRQENGKGQARRLRSDGKIPAVCYGRNSPPLPLAVDTDALLEILRGPLGRNALIRLDGAEDRTVFVQEMQTHPVERNPLHVDFLAVSPDDPVRRSVKVKFEGRPVGVKHDGRFQVIRQTMDVECLPANIPASVSVDISEMDIGDVMHVADAKLPEGVSASYEQNYALCAVTAAEAEEEAKPAEGEAAGEEGAAAPAAEKAEGEAEKKEGS